MSRKLPKGTLSRGRSGFSMIDPETELYHHKLGRAQHVAISYVWSEWQNLPGSGLPDWQLLRTRLLELVGQSASSFMKILTGHRVNCWLDSKCIDQSSSEDKSYWIPRMDEVYSEARCTILLLRNIDLGPLVEAEQCLACDIDDDSHNCLLTQSCTAITDISDALSLMVVAVLKALYDGTWRKRAWIFQEILLSEEYVLSGENNKQLKLSDCGVLASLLFRKYPNQPWLGDFANWCRRLFYLRKRYHLYDLCIANVLQMAQSLQATVEADKYYALSGLLRLKTIKYNGAHSADDALKALICKLTEQGRLSWLYAIRPAPMPDQQALYLSNTSFSRYVDLTCRSGSFYAKPHTTSSSIGFHVSVLGSIQTVMPVSQVLENTVERVSSHGTNFPSELRYMAAVPQILYRLAQESVRPLLQQPLLARLRLALGIDKGESTAEIVWRLYLLESPEKSLARPGLDISALETVASASWALKRHIASLQDEFGVVLWHKPSANDLKGKGKSAQKEDNYMIALSDINVNPDAQVCRVSGDSLMLAAGFDNGASTELTSWSGALIPLHDSDLSTDVALQLSRLVSWISRKGDSRSRNLAFAISQKE
jgi:hypothetical protein